MRLELLDIGKTYGSSRTALEGVTLTFGPGLHGLLGPNGAGKSTLMKIATGLIAPSSGRVLVDGSPLEGDRDRVRARLGYLGQEWGAPKTARCSEVLDLVLSVRGITERARRRSETQRLLTLVGLQDVPDRRVKALSGGMLRRLGVAQALAGDPELLVMDEPTVGLDPTERVEFRRLLTDLGRQRTILLSTHIVADVGTTCQRVAVLSGGRVIYDGSPTSFAERARGRVFEIVPATPAEEDALRARYVVVASTPTALGARLRLVGEPPGTATTEVVEPTLEDAYLLEVGAEPEAWEVA